MSSTKDWQQSEYAEIILYIFIGLLLTVILPIFGGFILRGFEQGFREGFSINTYLGEFIVYLFLMIGSLFLIIFPIARLIKGNRKEHPADDNNANWLTILSVSLIHSPEENGALYRLFHSLGYKGNKNPMTFFNSIFRNFIWATLIFGALGLVLLSNPQLAVAGVPQTSQQVTVASDVIFGAAVPSFSENGVLCIIFFLLLGIDAYICSKLKLGIGGFFAIAFLFICPLMGFFWASFHNIVYAHSEAKWFATFVFGWIGSTLTLLFANVLWWLMMHFFNNTFLKLQEVVLFKEDIYLVAIAVWIVLLVIYIFGEMINHNIKKDKEPKPVVVPD